jgi:aminopeptidase 2
MGQIWRLGAYMALLLLINITSSSVIPLRELQFNPDRYSDSRSTRADEDYHLPKTVKPESYKITLTPNFESFTFTGIVDITVTALLDTDSISLHYDRITVNTVTVTKNSANVLLTQNYDLDTNIFTLVLDSTFVTRETATIHIEYDGILHDDMAGFYRSSYTTADGQVR